MPFFGNSTQVHSEFGLRSLLPTFSNLPLTPPSSLQVPFTGHVFLFGLVRFGDPLSLTRALCSHSHRSDATTGTWCIHQQVKNWVSCCPSPRTHQQPTVQQGEVKPLEHPPPNPRVAVDRSSSGQPSAGSQSSQRSWLYCLCQQHLTALLLSSGFYILVLSSFHDSSWA